MRGSVKVFLPYTTLKTDCQKPTLGCRCDLSEHAFDVPYILRPGWLDVRLLQLEDHRPRISCLCDRLRRAILDRIRGQC